MIDYKKMYTILCSAVSEALDVLPHETETDSAYFILQQALMQAENIYIEADETDLKTGTTV